MSRVDGALSLPWYPLLLPVAWLLSFFETTVAPPEWLLRPVILVGVASTLVVVCALLVTRHWDRAGVVAAIGILGLLGLPLGSVFLAAGVLLVHQIQKVAGRGPGRGSVTRYGNLLSLLLLIIVSAQIVPMLSPTSVPSSTAPALTAGSNPPDIYLLWLDGYARSDTLREFGFDNDPFEDALGMRGFAVSPAAVSSYRSTPLTMLTMLHMAHVAELRITIPPGERAQARLVRDLIQRAPALAALRGAGYEIIAAPAGIAQADVRAADVVINHGYPTEFEHALLSRSAVGWLLNTLAPETLPRLHAERVHSTLASVADATGPQPLFVLGHVISPHAPFVLDLGDKVQPMPACYPLRCGFYNSSVQLLGISREEYAVAYVRQVEALNEIVVRTVDEILRRSASPPVIIVLSDHGSRYDDTRPDEAFRPFFAAYTPDHPNLFGDSPSPTQVLAVLLNSYLGGDFPVPGTERYQQLGPLEVELFAE